MPVIFSERIHYVKPLGQTCAVEPEGDDPVVWFYTPMALPLLQCLHPSLVVYDCMDELAAFKNSPKQLLQRPFPYLMAWYQAPTDGSAHPETQLHAEFSPPYRTRDRLKYLAGTELGAGMFAMDALPEEKARELQRVDASLEAP